MSLVIPIPLMVKLPLLFSLKKVSGTSTGVTLLASKSVPTVFKFKE